MAQPDAGREQHESANQEPVHVLSLLKRARGPCWLNIRCTRSENEISAVTTWLQAFQVQDRIVSADAMHTQRFFCALLIRWRSHYLLIAKKNQPQLYSDLELFFEDPQADRSGWQSAHSCSKGHGRLEIREITTSTDLKSFFERDWEGIAQTFRLQRTVKRKGKTSKEVVYGLSSLPPKLADAARLLQLNRAHWQMENRLHWRRDVTLGEDHCQVRTGAAPQVLAALNNAILALADALHISNLAAQMRTFNAHPDQALALLLGSDF